MVPTPVLRGTSAALNVAFAQKTGSKVGKSA
jgi:hypothetical protein